MKKTAGEIFAKCDVNNDGQIDKQELKSAMLRDSEVVLLPPGLAGDSTEEQVEAVFAFMDSSGDGKLSKDELFAFCDAFIDSIMQ